MRYHRWEFRATRSPGYFGKADDSGYTREKENIGGPFNLRIPRTRSNSRLWTMNEIHREDWFQNDAAPLCVRVSICLHVYACVRACVRVCECGCVCMSVYGCVGVDGSSAKQTRLTALIAVIPSMYVVSPAVYLSPDSHRCPSPAPAP